MKGSGNTVLITGGSMGIGLALAKILSEHNNKVIITGRNEGCLINAVSQLRHVTAIASDVSKAQHVEHLIKRVKSDFPSLNVVINNARLVLFYSIIKENVNAVEKAEEEMHANFYSVIRLNEKLLPLLKSQPQAAIVNVSSTLTIYPSCVMGYLASKAALHSYTQSLRKALEQVLQIKVFELIPNLAKTDLSRETESCKVIESWRVAEAFYKGWQKDEYEIYVA